MGQRIRKVWRKENDVIYVRDRSLVAGFIADEYVPKQVVKMKAKTEFEITCTYCKNKGWRGKSNAKYCSDSCKSLAARKRRNQRENEKSNSDD